MNENETLIYLFSGLGADSSVFDNLLFLKERKHKFIEWEKPKNNDLKSYALQLSSQIDTTKKVILISSASNPNETPALYRFFGKLKFYFFIPTFLLNKPNKLLSFELGINQKKYKKEEQQLYRIIRNSNPKFAKSFIKMILNWKQKEIKNGISNNSIFRIHGTNDLVIPFSTNRLNKDDFLIENGGHFMILTHSEEINILIKEIIENP